MKIRSIAALLVLAGALEAQDRNPPAAENREAGDFTFSFKQEWTLRADNETNLAYASDADLIGRLQPTFAAPLQPNPLGAPNAPRPAPRKIKPSTKPRGVVAAKVRQSRTGVLEVKGSFSIGRDGNSRFSFDRIEYLDASQKWWIEIKEPKIRAYRLAGKSRWTGTRQEWMERLAEVERLFIDAYLKVTTPQGRKADPTKLRVPVRKDPQVGLRLFMVSSLEKQMVALLLSRLDGAVLEKAIWPEECAKYPPRVIIITRSILDRLRLQSRGELAPPAARKKRSRTVKNVAWVGPHLALPSFHWGNAAEWTRTRAKAVEQARTRLTAIAANSRLTLALTEADWYNAVLQEHRLLAEIGRVAPLGVTPTPRDALGPRSLNAGKGIYDYKERLSLQDGKFYSSRVESYGLAKEWDVAFFHSGQNRWRASRIRFDIQYRGEIKRK